MTPFRLLPLITGRLPREIKIRLAATLRDPARFSSRSPVPTAIRNDSAFSPFTMWRDPVQMNGNHLLIDGLLRSGRPADAAALRQRTLAMAKENDTFHEYCRADHGRGVPHAKPALSWAAATFIDVVLRETVTE